MKNYVHFSPREMTAHTDHLVHEDMNPSTQLPLVHYHIRHAPAFSERLKTHIGESVWVVTIEDKLSGRLVDVSKDAITVIKNENPYYIPIDHIAYFEKS